MTKHHFSMAIMAVILLMIFCTGFASADFTMERKNSTVAYTAISPGAVIYRGDTVRFTPDSGSSWEWDFGDGFTGGDHIPEHYYAWGKRPIIMHDGHVVLYITLTTDGTTKTTHSVDMTTLLPPLVIQTGCVTLLNENLSKNYTEELTGNRTAPPGWSGFDWVGGIGTTVEAYVYGAGQDVGGGLGMTIFLILVFSIPFIMIWIIMKDFIVPGILGGFLGVFIIVRLPSSMQPLAVCFIVMSIVAVIYSLLKET